MKAPTAMEYIDKARELHEVEGEIEVDRLPEDEHEDDAEVMVSRSEDGTGEVGAYVRAWVWVNREELQPNYMEDPADDGETIASIAIPAEGDGDPEKATRALEAIVARVRGVYDDPALLSFGPLRCDKMADILRLATEGL